MIPAFLAAYAGSDPSRSNLTAFPAIPLPNWRITYDGFIKVPYFKKRFKPMAKKIVTITPFDTKAT